MALGARHKHGMVCELPAYSLTSQGDFLITELIAHSIAMGQMCFGCILHTQVPPQPESLATLATESEPHSHDGTSYAPRPMLCMLGNFTHLSPDYAHSLPYATEAWLD